MAACLALQVQILLKEELNDVLEGMSQRDKGGGA
jgi:hypothetical protein